MQVDRAHSGDAAAMLRDALGLTAAHIELHSREPLGDGAVVGFEVTEPGGASGEVLGETLSEAPDESGGIYFVDTSGLPVARETGWVAGGGDAGGDDAGGDAGGAAAGADNATHGRAPAVRIWRHPEDPHLPALPAVSFPDALAALLARAGIAVIEPPEMVAYRPGRRAVLRVVSAAGPDGAARADLWVKIVRPSRVERIVDAQAACIEAGLPVPAVRFWSPEGLVVFDAAAGTPATDVEWSTEPLLDEVDALRGRFAAVRSERPLRGVGGRLDWYASSLGGSEAAALSSRIGARLAAARPPASAVVHGDLHFGQLFLDAGGRVSGVIDVDTLGLGDPAEDQAAFLGHAIASALLTEPTRATRVWDLADAASERWASEGAVAPLTAIHLLGHALAAGDRGDTGMRDQLLAAAGAVLDGSPPSTVRPPGDPEGSDHTTRTAGRAESEDEKPLMQPLAET